MVPVLIHTPPIISLRSMMATRLPSLAAAIAAFWPPGPDPSTTTSTSYTAHLILGEVGRSLATLLCHSIPRTTLNVSPERLPGLAWEHLMPVPLVQGTLCQPYWRRVPQCRSGPRAVLSA